MLHDGPRSLANTSIDIPRSLFSKCLLHAFTILGTVTSEYGNSTNSCGPVRLYFLAFPVASVANSCTVISFLSKIETSLGPPLFCPLPDLAFFFAFTLFVLFGFILFANFLQNIGYVVVFGKIWDHCGTILVGS